MIDTLLVTGYLYLLGVGASVLLLLYDKIRYNPSVSLKEYIKRLNNPEGKGLLFLILQSWYTVFSYFIIVLTERR